MQIVSLETIHIKCQALIPGKKKSKNITHLLLAKFAISVQQLED